MARSEPGADDGFGAALGLRLRWNGIKLGGIEDVDAAVDRVVHLRVAFGFGILLAEGHGAEAERADFEASAA